MQPARQTPALLFRSQVERIGEHSPIALRAAFDAAVLPVADAVEAGGIDDRQRLQHHGVNEGENRGGRADAERQRQHRGERKDRRLPHLAESVG